MKAIAASIALSALTGCAFAARNADTYSADTRALLTTQNTDLKTCYEKVRAEQEDAHGQVVVTFTVAADTGLIQDPQIVEGTTTAPAEIQQCVLTSLEGLTLEPGDQRDGDATFVWEFGVE